MTRRTVRREHFDCPNCGAEVPVGARVCRECGSDDRTGWQSSEEIDYQSLELPEDSGGPPRHGVSWRWVLAALLLVAFTLWAVLR